MSEDISLTPFSCFKEMAPARICELLAVESPQVQAVVLCHLDIQTGSAVLKHLPQAADVKTCIAHMGTVAPDVIREVERMFERSLEYPVRPRLGGTEFLRQLEDSECQKS